MLHICTVAHFYKKVKLNFVDLLASNGLYLWEISVAAAVHSTSGTWKYLQYTNLNAREHIHPEHAGEEEPRHGQSQPHLQSHGLEKQHEEFFLFWENRRRQYFLKILTDLKKRPIPSET
jgi:hypothetical protein